MTGGTTYYIQVDGFSSDTGSITLNVADVSPLFADPGATPGTGDGSAGSPFGSLQDAIDAAISRQTIIVTAAGTFPGPVVLPPGKNLTLELPAGEVVIDGAFTTASALTVTGTGSLAVLGAFEVVVGFGGAVTAPFPLRTGPVVRGTAGTGNDTGWYNLAFAKDATAADVLGVLDLQGVQGPVLYTFDPLAGGSGSTQGAFVPVTSGATPFAVGATPFWLYLFDDAQQPVAPATPVAPTTSGTYDLGNVPGTGFGPGPLDVTLSGPIDCTSFDDGGAFVNPGEIFFYLGNPRPGAYDLAGLSLPSEGFAGTAVRWDGDTGMFESVTGPLGAGQAAYFECDGGPAGTQSFDGTLTFGTPTIIGPPGGELRAGTPAAQGQTLATQGEAKGKRGTQASRPMAAPFAQTAPATARIDLQVATTVGTSRLGDRSATLFFHEDGAVGSDAYDFTKLAPVADAQGRALMLSLMGAEADGTPARRAIEALPLPLPQAVTLDAELMAPGVPAGTPVTLSVPTWEDVPAGWTVQLLDTATGDVVDLRPGASYTFATTAAASLHGGDAAHGGGKDAAVGLALPARPVPRALDALAAEAAAHGKSTPAPRFRVRVSPAGTIPVELAGLTAQADGQAVTLTWQTLTETTNAGFAVEARQADGTFAEVAFVAGAGTTTEPQTYRHRLANVPYGQHAYRLRQVDFDGTTAPSQAVEVTVELADAYALAAYPNPVAAGQQATVDVTAREAQAVTVAVYDMLGRRVATLFDGEVAASATERLRLPARGLASGVYVVRAVGERFTATRRVTVVR